MVIEPKPNKCECCGSGIAANYRVCVRCSNRNARPIILTAQQAAELHTTGRLTGYREKPEVELPEGTTWLHASGGKYLAVGVVDRRPFAVFLDITPPRDTDTTYAVKEPWKFAGFSHEDGRTCSIFFFSGEVLPADLGDWRPAEELPDGQERQHARITDRKLIIEDGELWWDFGDLEKVAK